MKEKIFVFGASGHAKVVIDIIEQQGEYEIDFLVDDDAVLKGRRIYGYTVLGGRDELLAGSIRKGIVAIGSNSARRAVAAWLVANGFELITATHPSAQLARGVAIGSGTVIMAGAVVNSDTTIGCHVIINTKASVDHDCAVGDGSHIAPGSTLCGTVTVGEESFVCAGAVIIPNLTIGNHVTIGAGSTVTRNLQNNVLAVGSPAKVIKSC